MLALQAAANACKRHKLFVMGRSYARRCHSCRTRKVKVCAKYKIPRLLLTLFSVMGRFLPVEGVQSIPFYVLVMLRSLSLSTWIRTRCRQSHNQASELGGKTNPSALKEARVTKQLLDVSPHRIRIIHSPHTFHKKVQ